nr:hypothetical protein [uncultured Ralstonia sp.]
MTTKRCACCGQSFQPRPQVPKQAYCSSPECQRARKRRWQQDKLRNDPDYRCNQRDAQRAWHERHPNYWRSYRDTHPEYAERNRDLQRSHSPGDHPSALATMDVSPRLDLRPGLYHIAPVRSAAGSTDAGWVVEITPVCVDCPCKKDACKERT